MSAGSSPKKRAGAGAGAGAPGAKSGGKSLNTSDRKALHARMKQRQLDLVGGGQVTLKHSSTHLVMDMPPLTPYAAYALGLTRANKATLGVQCPDDAPIGLNDELWSFLKRRPDIIGTPPLRERRPDARVRAVFKGVCVCLCLCLCVCVLHVYAY